MALTEAERAATSTSLQRTWSGLGLPCGITKADLRAAVDAIDTWCDDNQASFNTAIPQPARTALTAAQKGWLLGYVVRKRIADL
jgi:hypothetical protein